MLGSWFTAQRKPSTRASKSTGGSIVVIVAMFNYIHCYRDIYSEIILPFLWNEREDEFPLLRS